MKANTKSHLLQELNNKNLSCRQSLQHNEQAILAQVIRFLTHLWNKRVDNTRQTWRPQMARFAAATNAICVNVPTPLSRLLFSTFTKFSSMIQRAHFLRTTLLSIMGFLTFPIPFSFSLLTVIDNRNGWSCRGRPWLKYRSQMWVQCDNYHIIYLYKSSWKE